MGIPTCGQSETVKDRNYASTLANKTEIISKTLKGMPLFLQGLAPSGTQFVLLGSHRCAEESFALNPQPVRRFRNEPTT